MRQWKCNCPDPTNLHTENEPECAACGFGRPPELAPLPDDQLARFDGLIGWLDGQLAKRPALLATTEGLALSQLVAAARRNPSGTYRTMAAAERALGATVGWVEHSRPAADDAFALLGPEG